MQVACVVYASLIDSSKNTVYLPGVGNVACDDMKASFPLAFPFLATLFQFAAVFNAFRLTQMEVALFCAVLLVVPGACFIA